jgi:glycine/D-amino acid oxidase-like deaminating enzyme/nitrite reductase/ring-hydroxylating ferredoxin subunit
MNLPGASDSLWMRTSKPSYPPMDGEDGRFDVVVIGAGITGVTTALRCKEQGLRVAVLEMGEVCQGVTGHTTAKISSLHELIYDQLVSKHGDDGARVYGQANESAIATIGQTVEELGIDCAFERRPHLTWTTDPERVDEVRSEAATAARLGLPARFTTDTDLPFEVAGAVVFDDQAQFHPRDYVLALAAAVHGDGSVVAEHNHVIDVDDASGDEPCRVHVEGGGTIRAAHVVLATHLPFLDRGGLFARAHPKRSYALSAVVDGPIPESMSMSADSPTRSLRPYIRDGVVRIIVGGGSHKPGADDDERRHWAALAEWAHEHFSVREIDHRWSAHDYVSVDELPYVGLLWPGTERIWAATGFRKWGMTNGTAAAVIISDGILGRANPWAATFDPNRVNLLASAKKLVKENLQVGKHFVGDRVGLPGREAVEALSEGEGVVARVDGSAYAVCRHAGATSVVSPVCTHMGCHVRWNRGEASWDCPCHGSQFSPDGTVIQGPATTDLERRSLPE